MRLDLAPMAIFRRRRFPPARGRPAGRRSCRRSELRRRCGVRPASRNSMSAAAAGRWGPGSSSTSATGRRNLCRSSDLRAAPRGYRPSGPQADLRRCATREVKAFVRAAPTGFWSAGRGSCMRPDRRTLALRTPRARWRSIFSTKSVFHRAAAALERQPRPRQSPGHRPVLPGHPAHESP